MEQSFFRQVQFFGHRILLIGGSFLQLHMQVLHSILQTRCQGCVCNKSFQRGMKKGRIQRAKAESLVNSPRFYRLLDVFGRRCFLSARQRRFCFFRHPSRHPAHYNTQNESPQQNKSPRSLCAPEEKPHLHHVRILNNERCKQQSENQENNSLRSHYHHPSSLVG
jgi:hypothetical protein